MASCVKSTWRGVIVCQHTVAKLNAWAVSVGSGILLKPLAGCGSYQTTTTASAGTHAGGGAIDIDLRAVPSDKRKWVADKGRTSGLQVSWHRNYIAGLWTWHAHALDPACPNLSAAAVSQIVEFGKGGDGLVGTTPDGNTRVNATEIMAIFAKRLFTGVAQAVANDVRVKQLQTAVRRTATGIWDYQTELDVGNTRLVAREGYTGTYFKKWNMDQKKRMQKSWGAYEDGIWGPATASAAKATVKKMQAALSVTQDSIWGNGTEAAYAKLRTAMYKAPTTTPTISTAPIAVNLSNTIYRSRLKIGAAKTTDVVRYQAALWNRASTATRAMWAKKWGITNRNVIVDGVYGKATADLTKMHYDWLAKSRPGQGWTAGATEPGPALLKYLGFTSVK